MNLNERHIPTEELKIGMYVAELDRPWEETPFPLQGFFIKTEEELKLLSRLCKHVYIERRSESRFQASYKAENSSTGSLSRSSGNVNFNEKLPLPKPVVSYTKTSKVEEEIKVAKKNHTDLSERFEYLFNPFKLDKGKKIEIDELKEPITHMVDSVIRNPDAYLRLTILKKKDNYTYNHCINMSILSVMFGRHLGVTEQDLNIIAWGAMFCDFGKALVPAELLTKPGRLSDEEFRTVKRHVLFSMDAVNNIEGFSNKAREIIHFHHERFNGTGYPEGRKGSEIPIFSRMVSIVDTYDAIINDRPYATAISPHEALRKLFDLRNLAFQPELIEVFIQAVGVYPIGTLVELTTGEVGTVISQNQVRHLKPQVMVLLNADKVAYKTAPILNLLNDPLAEDGKKIEIKNVLEPGSYGIRSDDFYNF